MGQSKSSILCIKKSVSHPPEFSNQIKKSCKVKFTLSQDVGQCGVFGWRCWGQGPQPGQRSIHLLKSLHLDVLHPAQGAADTTPRLQGQHGGGGCWHSRVHDGGGLSLALLLCILFVVVLFLPILLQPLPWWASSTHSKLDSTAGIGADGGLVTAACRLTARAWLRRLRNRNQTGKEETEEK